MERKLRILIAKPGLDGHDRGAKVVARALRDGGFEVVYTGLHQTPEQIVSAAIQEDVDAVGLSLLSGAHKYLFPKVVELLKENQSCDIKVFAEGLSPGDIPWLQGQGFRRSSPWNLDRGYHCLGEGEYSTKILCMKAGASEKGRGPRCRISHRLLLRALSKKISWED